MINTVSLYHNNSALPAKDTLRYKIGFRQKNRHSFSRINYIIDWHYKGGTFHEPVRLRRIIIYDITVSNSTGGTDDIRDPCGDHCGNH